MEARNIIVHANKKKNIKVKEKFRDDIEKDNFDI